MENNEHSGDSDGQRDPGADSEEISGPILSLAGGFDSFDATMRLAAITGLEHKLDAFSDSQKILRLKERSRTKLSGDSTHATGVADWANDTAAAHMNGSGKTVDTTLRNVWISSAILLLGTIVILFVA
jgi:hypothetical protein